MFFNVNVFLQIINSRTHFESNSNNYSWPFSSTPTSYFNQNQKEKGNVLIQVLLISLFFCDSSFICEHLEKKQKPYVSTRGPTVNLYSYSESITPWFTPIYVQDPSRSSSPKCITISFLADIPRNWYAHKENWAARKIAYHFAIIQTNNNAQQRRTNQFLHLLAELSSRIFKSFFFHGNALKY